MGGEQASRAGPQGKLRAVRKWMRAGSGRVVVSWVAGCRTVMNKDAVLVKFKVR